MSALDGVFWLGIGTLVCGGFGLLIKLIYKIKCTQVECCCLKFTRDIDDEIKLDLSNVQTAERRFSLGLNKSNKTTQQNSHLENIS